MAGVSDEIRIRIITDVKQATRELAALGISFMAIKRAVKEVVQFFTECEQAFFQSEQATTKLNAVLRSTGGTAGYTADELRGMADEMQRLTVFDDEAVISAQAVLATFTRVGRDVFPQAVEAATNMSTVLGQDLQSSIIQVGKALQDPILGVTALRRVGVMLTEQQAASIKTFMAHGDVLSAQKIILGELTTEFGGAAKAMGETAYGASVKLKNAIGELKEAIGENIAQSMKPFREWLTRVVQGMEAAERAANAFEKIMRGGVAGESIETLGMALERMKRQLADLKNYGSLDEMGTQFEAQKKEIANLENMIALTAQQMQLLERVAYYEKDPKRLAQLKAQAAVDGARLNILDAWNEEHAKEIELTGQLIALEGFRFGNEPGVEAKRLELIKQITEQLKKLKEVTEVTKEVTVATSSAQEELSNWYVQGFYSANQLITPVERIMSATDSIATHMADFVQDMGGELPVVTKALATDWGDIATAISAAGQALAGDFLGAFQQIFGMLPGGQIASAVLGILDQISSTIEDGMLHVGDQFGSSISQIFTDAITSGDWSNVEQAMKEQLRSAIINAVVASAALAPYIAAFKASLNKWLNAPDFLGMKDMAWNELQQNLQALQDAGNNLPGIINPILGELDLPPVASGRASGPSGRSVGGNTYVVHGSLIMERDVDRRIASGYARKVSSY